MTGDDRAEDHATPTPDGGTDLEARVRAFGNGTARATHSLIDRALAGSGGRDSAPRSGASPSPGPARSPAPPPAPAPAPAPVLSRPTALNMVKLARSLEFDGDVMARFFTADTDRAAAFLFAASYDGGCGPREPAEVKGWAEALAEAHAVALYHLRSQLWERSADKLASGKTMDDVLGGAVDDGEECDGAPLVCATTRSTFKRHVARLRARLERLVERHVPSCTLDARPRRVRWGHASGRLPDGTWARRTEGTDTFRQAVAAVVAERGFEPSMRAAEASFARGSIVAVADFGEDMDVAGMIRDVDLREIRVVSEKPADLIANATALRTTIAKNLWVPAPEHADHSHAVAPAGELEVFRDGGWFPWSGTPYEAARTLVVSTILDLDRVRASSEWARSEFPRAFAASPAADVACAVALVADMLATSTFLAPLERASRRRFAETVVPIAPVQPLPIVPSTACAGGSPNTARLGFGDIDSDADSSAPTVRIYASDSEDDEWAGDVAEAVRGPGAPDREPLLELEAVPGPAPDRNRGRADRTTGGTLFVETDVSPPLRVRDVHEEAAPAGGAACFDLHRESGRWLAFADQARGSVHITAVNEYLGYRGFGRSSFLVDAYGPDGDFHGGTVVAVVGYDRSRLEATVAAKMDSLEGVPIAQARVSRPVYRPYIVRGLRITRPVAALVTDRVSPFPEIVHDPPPTDLYFESHRRVEDVYVYTYAGGGRRRPLRLPCEGWGPRADAHLRSSVRAYWAHKARLACPHDMRMRLTRATTHVVFADADGRAQSVRYAFTPRTVRNVWDGSAALAEERSDSIVYVIDNDVPGCVHRLVVVAGYVIGSGELPRSTARMIEGFWRRRGQTCPHAPFDVDLDGGAEAGSANASSSSNTLHDDGLVARIDLDASDAAAWLSREARLAAARTARH